MLRAPRAVPSRPASWLPSLEDSCSNVDRGMAVGEAEDPGYSNAFPHWHPRKGVDKGEGHAPDT
jgi:hypothetical protein